MTREETHFCRCQRVIATACKFEVCLGVRSVQVSFSEGPATPVAAVEEENIIDTEATSSDDVAEETEA